MTDIALVFPSAYALDYAGGLRHHLDHIGLVPKVVEYPRPHAELSREIRGIPLVFVAALGTKDEQIAGMHTLMRASKYARCIGLFKPEIFRSEWASAQSPVENACAPMMRLAIVVRSEGEADHMMGNIALFFQNADILRANGKLSEQRLSCIAQLIAGIACE